MPTHSRTSLKQQERLWRRLRRQPILLLSAQIKPDAPLKIFTVNRVLAIFDSGDIEQWFGVLGGYDRNDPNLSACFDRGHARAMFNAAAYRRMGRYQVASGFVRQAAKIRHQHKQRLPS